MIFWDTMKIDLVKLVREGVAISCELSMRTVSHMSMAMEKVGKALLWNDF